MLNESFVYIASKSIPSLIAFATGMALTWLLSPADYGVYGLGLAVVIFVSSAFFDWHAISFMRFYQSNAENPTFMPTILQSFLLACLCTGILALLICGTGLVPADYRTLIWICVPGCWCYSWFELASRMQVARFHPGKYFWMNLARSVCILIFAVALAWLTHSPFFVLGGCFAGMLLAGILFNTRNLSLKARQFDSAIAARLMRFGWPVAIVHFLGGFSFAIDRILIETFTGKASVGFYTAAYALAQTTIVTIGAGIDSAAYSRAVRAADGDDSSILREQLARNCTLLLALMVPAAVGMALVAPALARLCMSPGYVASVATLIPWMAVGALILGFRANYVDHAFHFGDSTARLIIVMVVTAAANLAADLLLIPRFGALGCAMSTIAGGSAGLICGIVVSRSVLVLPFPGRDMAKIAVSTLAMALCLWPFRERTGSIALAIEVLGGVLIFASGALATNLLGVRRLAVAKLRANRGFQ